MHRLLVMAENILDTATFFILNLQGLLDKYWATGLLSFSVHICTSELFFTKVRGLRFRNLRELATPSSTAPQFVTEFLIIA
jgi:hypothetical protein